VRGLPAGWYTDAARGPHERDQVFLPSWQFVCHESDLPAVGTAARFDCAGRSAIVLRTSSGALNGFANVCRHRGARIVDGDAHTGLAFCVDGRLRCPYHGWTYEETGALSSVPTEQSFDDFDHAGQALTPLHVERWRGLVFVALGQPARSLADQLDAAGADWPDTKAMRRLREPRLFPLQADWKIACEQLLDVCHLSVVRPGLKPRVFEVPVFKACGADALRASVAAVDTWIASWSARAYQRLLLDARLPARAGLLFLWPNTLLLAAPDGLGVAQVLPGPTGQCSLRHVRYGAPDSSRSMILLRYVHERVMRRAREDDRRIVERTQQGIAGIDPAATGPIARQEQGLRWFAERYRSAMTAQAPATKLRPPRARRSRKASPAVEA
jgi:phenylpropionate dioxygenase-like ring-hydroxylating dioxygenase large terminal subunit